jgi:methyl-accepting chemotaxis protein
MQNTSSVQTRITLLVCGFFALLVIVTLAVIELTVSPDLAVLEGKVVSNEVDQISVRISEQLRKVEAQQRSIVQTVALLDSDQIDKLQPGLVDQNGDPNVFGGGIWPLPGKRQAGRDKFSTFFARDAATNELKVNTHWNSPESLKYWEQPWYENGKTAARGHCKWANAYQDDASPQPRTNCAMPIYKGDELYGVSTIDVTLGFFNRLVADMEDKVHGRILIVEGDGKIVSNSSQIKENIVLKHVADIAGSSPMASQIQRMLPQAKEGSRTSAEYQADGTTDTLFLQSIPGSPWFIATSIDSSLLAAGSKRILVKLAAVQVPMALLLLGMVVGSVRLLMKRLATLQGNIEALSAGEADLTQRLPETGGQEFAAVARSFNKFIARLDGVVRQVVTGSSSIATASVEIAGGNQELSSRTQEQAAFLQQTAASMEQFSSTVQSNAETARMATQIAGTASEVASRGGQAVDEVVATMEAITGSSKRISDIIGVIDGIAFQTNILALNAAVEAARAGEQGRGFAVVASEVRSLAQRCAAAAKEIKGLINSSAEQVEMGSHQVAAAGATMSEIVAQVRRVNDLIGEISSATQEQGKGIGQVSHAVAELEKVTQQNSALVEQSAAAAESLRQHATQLEVAVSVFKVSRVG